MRALRGNTAALGFFAGPPQKRVMEHGPDQQQRRAKVQPEHEAQDTGQTAEDDRITGLTCEEITEEAGRQGPQAGGHERRDHRVAEGLLLAACNVIEHRKEQGQIREADEVGGPVQRAREFDKGREEAVDEVDDEVPVGQKEEDQKHADREDQDEGEGEKALEKLALGPGLAIVDAVESGKQQINPLGRGPQKAEETERGKGDRGRPAHVA